MSNPRHGYWLFLLLSIGGGFITAATYIWATSFSVSSADLAYHQSLVEIFSDPFVFMIAVPAGTVAGVLVSPFAYFFLRGRRLSVAFPIILVLTVATVALATPRFGLLGIPAGLAAVIGSCVLCARIPLTEADRLT